MVLAVVGESPCVRSLQEDFLHQGCDQKVNSIIELVVRSVLAESFSSLHFICTP